MTSLMEVIKHTNDETMGRSFVWFLTLDLCSVLSLQLFQLLLFRRQLLL